jgi:hypothetical protein
METVLSVSFDTAVNPKQLRLCGPEWRCIINVFINKCRMKRETL